MTRFEAPVLYDSADSVRTRKVLPWLSLRASINLGKAAYTRSPKVYILYDEPVDFFFLG